MDNTSKSEDLFLIEVRESDIEKLNVPFVVYANVGKDGHKKLKALYAQLNQDRKNMADTYKAIDEYYKKNYNDS